VVLLVESKEYCMVLYCGPWESFYSWIPSGAGVCNVSM